MYKSNNYIIGPKYKAGGQQTQATYSVDKASLL